MVHDDSTQSEQPVIDSRQVVGLSTPGDEPPEGFLAVELSDAIGRMRIDVGMPRRYILLTPDQAVLLGNVLLEGAKSL